MIRKVGFAAPQFYIGPVLVCTQILRVVAVILASTLLTS